MVKTKKLPTGRLTEHQKYLLRRVPRAYDMNGHDPRIEPSEVKQARKVVERWDKEEEQLACQARKRNEALSRKAIEAVYFTTPERALAIIQQCEKHLKGCPV